MNTNFVRWSGGFVLFLAFNALATVHYVNVNSANPTPPYTDWSTASTDIQDAIDASTNGDIVLVTNGVYETGGLVISGLTNRVALTNAITVQSVNGPWVTIIQGAGTNLGPSAVRCAWLTNNATLIGFTLQGGATLTSGTLTTYGGGVWCASGSAVVDNCVITSNNAYSEGGGVYQGAINNCFISGNGGGTFLEGGGAAFATLNSCTIISNTANNAAGVYQTSMTNCIVYYNDIYSGSTPQNYSLLHAIAFCCTTPLPTGNGNFTNLPQLFADGVHLLSTSPCIGTGTNIVTGTDIFGNAWANPPSVGCAEYYPSPVVAQPSIVLTNPLGFAVNAAFAGSPATSFAWLMDGSPLQNAGQFTSTQTTNLVVTGVSLADAGNYQLVASNSFGVITSAVTTLAIHCVNEAGSNPVSPYSSWAAAATNIQDAITVAAKGDIVLVTNGVYEFGSQSMDGVSSNRVSLNKAIRVQSVNGPWVTTIQGGGATNGKAAIRCAWLTNNAVLVGFALEAGATPTSGTILTESGGGIWCASSSAVVDNCVIVSNTAANSGGGVYQGTYNNCLISSNRAMSTAYGAVLNSCTIVSNSTYGVESSAITNCIVYYNGSPNNYSSLSAAAFCCVTPAITGTGNFTNAPQFQAGGVFLSAGSPCIGAGTNLVIGTDIFGLAWADPPSVGCAEYNPLPTVSQPQITLTSFPIGFEISNVVINGQPPLTLQWMENGVPLQTNGQFSSTQMTNLVATGVSLADSGSYQLVVSNAFGVVTSAVAQLNVHAVNVAGVHPQPPYLTWDTAATNIQDAIGAASAGDIVLVTNGIYEAGITSMDGVSTNRVSINKALAVVSVNGWTDTIIEGAWDPVSTNGPGAVRCAWLTNGAVLSGFTLQNGATQKTGGTTTAQSGGGVWCASTSALLLNCLLSNNFANADGGGIYFGTLNNSLVLNNVASTGGGACNATLNNCTVQNNYTTFIGPGNGGGTSGGVTRNSIVVNNYYGYPETFGIDNFGLSGTQYSYCCTQNPEGSIPVGTGNTSADPQFLDWYHISVNSPCRGAGSALYATGTDLDGETWNTPPSIGCDEVVLANRTGPLSVALGVAVVGYTTQTNVLVNQSIYFNGTITGLATYAGWNFGNSPQITNADYYIFHTWTNTGSYNVVFTAYNDDYPAGVSTNVTLQVVPLNPPPLQAPTVLSNGIQFQFTGQYGADYTVQYATNLNPPVTWSTLQTLDFSTGGVYDIQDSTPTNAARFYRVKGQVPP